MVTYTVTNIQLVSKIVNMMKGKYSQEEFIKVCTDVANNIEHNRW